MADAPLTDPWSLPGLHLPNHWTARPYQDKLWNYLCKGGKYAVCCWHRRAGKDEVCLHNTACALWQRVGNYAHMLPEYSQARKAIWTAVNPHTGKRRIDEAFPEEMRIHTRDQEMMIEFANGSTWQVVGSDNYNSLMGSSYAGIVMSEYALCNPSAWGYLAPILMENGGWALFISTPRGKNHFYSMLRTAQSDPEWFAEVLTNDDTGVFTEAQMAGELGRLQAMHGDTYGKSLWLQEYYASFDAAIPGSIWGDCVDRAQKEGRILDFPMDPSLPVYTAWDLGRTDDTSIWFYQLCGREISVFDHHASSLKEIEFYVQEVLLPKQRESGLRYVRHWLPHDARPRRLGMGGKSVLQQFKDLETTHPSLGSFAINQSTVLDRQEGIQAARATFPYCRFHATRCAKGLESLKHYHREWDDELKKFVDEPVHDWASHDADAFRYLSLSWKFERPTQPDSPLIDKLMAGNITGLTFGQMKQQHFDKRRHGREWAMM